MLICLETMPVTFYGESNLARGKIYVDPVFRYDSLARVSGREQYHDSPDKSCFGKRTDSRVSTPVSKYNRAYSRCATPDDAVDNDTVATNVCRGDQAFDEMGTGTKNFVLL